MFIFAMLIGLIFLIAGGAGLFYTLVYVSAATSLWIIGLIVFGTFVLIGLILLILLAIYNTEFE